MPVPTAISELSTTPGSNSPVGADAPSVLDDHIRALGAFIRQLSDEKLAGSDGSVTTAKIADSAVTTVKVADSAVTTAKIAADAVTFAKLQDIATARILGRLTAGSGDAEELTATQVTASFVSAASSTAGGKVELATDAEAQAGTDTTRAVTPDNLGATVLGMGQTWQDLTASRALSTTYTNSTGRTIAAIVTSTMTTSGTQIASVNGAVIAQQSAAASEVGCITFIIPPGAQYAFGSSAALSTWFELR